MQGFGFKCKGPGARIGFWVHSVGFEVQGFVVVGARIEGRVQSLGFRMRGYVMGARLWVLGARLWVLDARMQGAA